MTKSHFITPLDLEPPVFVVGSSRSGTTLLYSIILSSGAFAVYQAETLLLDVCLPRYGQLINKNNFKRFMNDWLKSKQHSRSGLENSKFEEEAKYHRQSYPQFLDFFMSSVAKKQGKKRWAEQTPSHIFHMKSLLSVFPGAKFIHVIRDGRDVALSKRKLGWTSERSVDPLKQIISAAINWELSIKHGRRQGEQIPDNYLEIKYEDIIFNLEDTLVKLNEFLDINVDMQKLNKSSIGSLGKGNTTFAEMEGISQKGAYHWKQALNDLEKNALLLIIGKTLKYLGYETDAISEVDFFSQQKLKAYADYQRAYLTIKRFLKLKTPLGSFTKEGLEI